MVNNNTNLTTITMQELYEQIYRSRPPVIDGLLYPGTYIFAGALWHSWPLTSAPDKNYGSMKCSRERFYIWL